MKKISFCGKSALAIIKELKKRKMIVGGTLGFKGCKKCLSLGYMCSKCHKNHKRKGGDS